MTEKFSRLPQFDPAHVPYAGQHNATSEAVIQLQRYVHQLQLEVAELKAESGRATPARKTAAK